MEAIYIKHSDDELYHHGIKGQRWGVRRFQNADGTLTSAGKTRLSDYREKEYKRLDKKYDKKISRLDRKITKKEQSGKIPKRDASKKAYLVGRKLIEKNALDKMTYKDMVKEKRNVGINIVTSVLASAATVPLAIATGGSTPIVGIIPSSSGSKEITRGVRMNTRIRRNPVTGQILIDKYKK